MSHLGTVRVEGGGALERLQAALTNDLGKVAPGRAQYTHLLDDADASVLDDIIVWWLDDERFDVMPNASNTERVVAAIGGEDVTASRAIIAVQGPAAREHLGDDRSGGRRHRALPGRRRPRWRATPARSPAPATRARTAWSWPCRPTRRAAVWEALLAAGLLPAGLGARDTLRLEAALPLHGHELGPGITPLQAGLGWVVAWDKDGGFRGRGALLAERERGVARRLRASPSRAGAHPAPSSPC